MTTSINGIPLHQLLSSCIDAAHRGCEVIRAVHSRSLSQTCRIAHTFKSTSHDDIDPLTRVVTVDPRSALTEADGASQAVVLGCLRSCWGQFMGSPDDGSDGCCSGSSRPKLWIVGEEDDQDQNHDADVNDLFERYCVKSPAMAPIALDLVKQPSCDNNSEVDNNNNSCNDANQKSHELIVFIDPLDGTREYIENRIHNVQCLIGITVDGVPVAGAVGLPFGPGSTACTNDAASNDNDADSQIIDHDNVIQVVFGWVAPPNDVCNRSDNVNTNPWNILSSGLIEFPATNKLPKHVPEIVASSSISQSTGLLSNLDENDDTEDDTLIILSGDSKKAALAMTLNCLEKEVLKKNAPPAAADSGVDNNTTTAVDSDDCSISYRKIISGGCGNKILYLGRRYELIKSRKWRKKRLRREESLSQEQTFVNCDSTTASSEATTTIINTATPTRSSHVSLVSSTTTPSSPPIMGTISISPPGSSSWDTAAPTAVLLSIDPNARITDLIGRPLIYDGVHLTNVHGVVVSSGEGAVKIHDELCGRLRRDEEFCRVIGVDSGLE